MHAKRDGVGGYACGRQAVVVDGGPSRMVWRAELVQLYEYMM